MMQRSTWLAMYAMRGGGFTTPEIEEERYQRDVKAKRLLPDMTSEELVAVFNKRLTLEEITQYRADPALWDAYYERLYK